MQPYTLKTFTIPTLQGISKESIEQHLGLYAGYVKNFTSMRALMEDLMQDSEKYASALAELQRRLSFEFDGMRLHEYYFEQFASEAQELSLEMSLGKALAAQYGSLENIMRILKNMALMRGPGWAMLYFDPEQHLFQTAYVGEQHQGHFVGLPVILALDVWEHAFILDYGAAGRAQYVDAFFNNLNWQICEERYAKASR